MATEVDDKIVQLLIDQRAAAGLHAWADYELRPLIPGQGGYEEHGAEALGFRYEYLGLQDVQAVSCKVCGALFMDGLAYMKSHRLRCGWSAAAPVGG
jgi:hypothetical protein